MVVHLGIQIKKSRFFFKYIKEKKIVFYYMASRQEKRKFSLESEIKNDLPYGKLI